MSFGALAPGAYLGLARSSFLRQTGASVASCSSVIVSLAREAHKKELGTFQELLFDQDEVRTVDQAVLATHLHNRWRDETDGEMYLRLDVVGPLVVRGEESTLGPYMHFATVDGVATSSSACSRSGTSSTATGTS